MPAVSVIMPVYNAGGYLRDAVDSILGQTFRDFELLAIDDGSTDGSAAILGSYTDPRVRVLRNEDNRGLVYTANRGLDEARGEYAAIMHADDIALPHRLEAQVRFLERNSGVGVIGSWYRTFGDRSQLVRPYADHERIAAALLFNAALGHPTVMFRGSLLRATGERYAAEELPAEDWGMWVRLARRTRLANIPDPLLRYRVHPASVTGALGSQHGPQSKAVRVGRVLYRALLAELGIEPTEAELDTHTAIGFGFPIADRAGLARAEGWLRRLIAANRRKRVYAEPAFSEVVGSRWSAVNFGRGGPLLGKVVGWARSPLFRHAVRGAITNRIGGTS